MGFARNGTQKWALTGRDGRKKVEEQASFRHGWPRDRTARRPVILRPLVLLLPLIALLALIFPRAAMAQPDFQLTVSPSNQTFQPGSSVSFSIGVAGIDGFSDPVSLSVSGLPSGVSGEFSRNPLTPPGTSFLTLTATTDAQLGSFGLTVTACDDGNDNGTCDTGELKHVATGQATVDFGLVPVCYGKVHGVVTDAETGQPIEGANLGGEVTTDATGSYTIDQVGLGENNSPIEIDVTAQKDEPNYNDYTQIGQYWHATESGVVIVCDQTTEVDLALVPVRPGFLSGTIVEGNPDPSDYSHVIPTSTPIQGASVSLYQLTGPDTTGADGRYDLSFHLGYNNTPIAATVYAQGPDLPYRHGYWEAFAPSRDVGPGQHLVQDLALVKQCTASISGHVIYGDTELPAANIPVSATNFPGNTDSDSTQTDAQGNFSFPELLVGRNNAPINFSVGAGAEGYNSASGFTSPATLGCGQHGDVSLVLEPAAVARYGVLEGHVYDEETGAPLAGVDVGLIATCPCDTTDADGHYRLAQIFVGTSDDAVTQVGVSADRNDYWETRVSPIEIHANQTSTQDLRLLRERFARGTGVVRDVITNAPIADAGISFGSQGDSTDAEGRYAVEGVRLGDRNAPADVSIHAFADGYWPKTVTAGVRADETTQQDFDLLPICRGATIAGKVVDAITQQPIMGASVGGGGVGATTDVNGDYRLENISVGTDNTPLATEVTASAPGYYTQTKTVTIFCGGAIVLDFGRIPTAFGAVEGYVTNKVTGDPIPNAFVGSEFGGAATTDAQGYYSFSDVPLDPDGSDRTWDITAMPDGFDAQTKPVTVQANTTSRLDFEFGNLPGKFSARGTVQTAQGPKIGFSAITNCNPSLSTRPSVVGLAGGGRIWTKTTVTESNCTDAPPASLLGFDTQTGTATGTFNALAPGGLNGQQGTLEWTYHEDSPDTVQFTLRDSSDNVVFEVGEQTPAVYRVPPPAGSPGGVWTRLLGP